MANNDDNEQADCANCHRQGPDLSFVMYDTAEIRKRSTKKYYTGVPRSEEPVPLCDCCEHYLFSRHRDPKHYWPSMVYVFLKQEYAEGSTEVPFQDRWNLIPVNWKPWWSNYFSSQMIDQDSKSLFRDVTAEKDEANEAINDLEWKKLALCMDRHFGYPEVRCPFGCSEFLHKVNTAPLEDFLWAFSNYQMKSYGTAVQKTWTDCISPSFPSTCLILEKFECRPSVALTDDGMMILCCREHSKYTKESYLHVPESPEKTGSIYSPNGNAFAPVVIRSRNIRNFKGNRFSDTFCTVIQKGGYSGIDCGYVTTASNRINKQDNMALMRDALSIQGRPDIKAQIEDRVNFQKSPTYMPETSVNSIIRFAESEFPDPSSFPQWKTSTYISCESAVTLQEKIYGETSFMLTEYVKHNGQDIGRLMRYVPPWPTHFVTVQTMDDWGQRIYPVRERSNGLWAFLCITGRVTDLWEAIANSVEDNRSWHGHWLRYATTALGFKATCRASKFFPLKDPETRTDPIYSVFDPPLEEAIFDLENLTQLFHRCGTVLVVESYLPDEQQLNNELSGKQVIICFNPSPANHTLPNQDDLLELRCLISFPLDDSSEESDDEESMDHFSSSSSSSRSGQDEGTREDMEEDIDEAIDRPCVAERTMYVRHAGKRFWVQRGNGFTSKSAEDWPDLAAWNDAHIAIYCRKKTHNPSDLTMRYLNVLGGQRSVVCHEHKCPLIVNHKTRKSDQCFHKCACPIASQSPSTSVSSQSHPIARCDAYAQYVCPRYANCQTGICKSHLEKAKQRCSECTNGTVMFLSPGGTDYGIYLGMQVDGGLEGNINEKAQAHIPPEELGPTGAYEVPQDLIDETYHEAESASEDEDDNEDDSVESENDELQEWLLQRGIESSLQNDEAMISEDQLREAGEDYPDSDPFATAGLFPTRTGTQQVDIELEQKDAFGYSIPLVTLFNEQGHLLTRPSHKIRMRKAHSAVCEKIVATNPSKVVPLVYAEAQLFPEIFYQSLDDGTIPGAIPTGLWCDAVTLGKFDIANLRKHAVSRINNPATLTSVHPAYHFMLMDLQVNIGLRGQDTRIVLHRGFADVQGKDGVRFRETSDAAELYGEASENHANVHKLSALCQERIPHFFFTQSCNQQTCRGLRVLREWITSNEAVEMLKRKYGIKHDEASRFLRESAASYILRSWNECADMWMKYIIHSKEAPIGKMEWAWYRKEFQDYIGNVFHIHAILRTIHDITTSVGREAILSKIRGCLADLVHYCELEEMKKNGYISSVEILIELLNQAKSYLTHNCTERCQILRTNQEGEQTFVCKVQDNYVRGFSPFQHTMQTMHVEHLSEAKAILRRLGMMDGDRVLAEFLKADRHVPVCSNYDPKFSPTNGFLFACFPSSQNLQVPTGYYICAYLTKYVAGLDEVAIVVFRPRDGYVKATIEPMHNTKITSNKKLAEAKKEKMKQAGRYLTQMEAITVLIGAPLVVSTKVFIHIPTAPREYRSSFLKRSVANQHRVPDSITASVVIGQEVRERKGFSSHRLFSSAQIDVILDEQQSNLTTCKITEFSVRPPELRFVNQVSLYYRWFERTRIISRHDKIEDIRNQLVSRLDRDLHKSEWIDGFNSKVTVRRGAISEILEYITRACSGNSLFGTRCARTKTVALFKEIEKLLQQFEWEQGTTTRGRTQQTSRRQYEEVCSLFLSSKKSCDLPVIWYTPVFPRNKTRFLIHFLLRFGRFETEYELMKQGDLKSAYIHAGLFDPRTPESRQQTFDNLLNVFLERCSYLQPSSIRQKDKDLILAQATFGELLLGQAVYDGEQLNREQNATVENVVQETPCVLQAHMREQTNEKIHQFAKNLTESFVTSLINDLQSAGFDSTTLPARNDILNLCFPDSRNLVTPRQSIPYVFPPLYSNNGRQNQASYNEQRDVLLRAKHSIDCFRNGHNHTNRVICGGPGNGKTTTTNQICLYAFSQGLKGIATSIVADRSKVLGGMHIHLLCGLQSKNASPGRTAEAALRALYSKPELFHFWKQLQFIYIDELGLVNAETLAVIDIIARKVKNSHRFMGGMFVIGTMDIYQLQPVNGSPVLLSMNVTTEFNFSELKESVRATNDDNLKKICNLSRTLQWTVEEEREFKLLIKENCKFVTNFDDPSIPEEAIFVFGRKAPCHLAEELVIQRIKRTYGSDRVAVSVANDEESTIAGNWRIASNPVSRDLSQKLKTKSELYLYEKGRYEFTHNLQNTYQQGQLAILLTFNKDDVGKEPLRLFKGPAGCKEFPAARDFVEDRLIELGWKPVMVPYDYSRPERIWGSSLVARRQQYGIRLRVASTIHASMGSTYSKLVTAVSNHPLYSGMDFKLWDAAQVVVLISRTRRCEDLYFVGSPDEVADQLLSALRKTSRYLPHIRTVLHKLCNYSDSVPAVLPPPPIFRPCDIILERVPAVYLLVSTRAYKYMYIGETEDIRKRLNDHNSGNGSCFTNNPRLRPWALFGYVYGFESRRQRKRFEEWWKRVAQSNVRMNRFGSPDEVLEIGQSLAGVFNRHHTHQNRQLRIQQCGQMLEDDRLIVG